MALSVQCHPAASDEATPRVTRSAADGHARVWLIQGDDLGRNGAIPAELRVGYTLAATARTNFLIFSRFEHLPR